MLLLPEFIIKLKEVKVKKLKKFLIIIFVLQYLFLGNLSCDLAILNEIVNIF